MFRWILEWFMIDNWREFFQLMLPALVALTALWAGIYALMIMAGD